MIDKSGPSTSQAPFLLYSDIDDLTDKLLAKLSAESASGDANGEKKVLRPIPTIERSENNSFEVFDCH